jgi:hypothetical protein
MLEGYEFALCYAPRLPITSLILMARLAPASGGRYPHPIGRHPARYRRRSQAS